MEIPCKIILQGNPCKAPILQSRWGALHIQWNKFLPVLYERDQESASQGKKDEYSKVFSFVFDPHQISVQQLTEIWPFTCKPFANQVKRPFVLLCPARPALASLPWFWGLCPQLYKLGEALRSRCSLMNKAPFFYTARVLYRIQSKPCYGDVSRKTKALQGLFKSKNRASVATCKPEWLQGSSYDFGSTLCILILLSWFSKSYPAFPRYSHARLPCMPNLWVSLSIQVFIPVKPFEEGNTKIQGSAHTWVEPSSCKSFIFGLYPKLYFRNDADIAGCHCKEMDNQSLLKHWAEWINEICLCTSNEHIDYSVPCYCKPLSSVCNLNITYLHLLGWINEWRTELRTSTMAARSWEEINTLFNQLKMTLLVASRKLAASFMGKLGL